MPEVSREEFTEVRDTVLNLAGLRGDNGRVGRLEDDVSQLKKYYLRFALAAAGGGMFGGGGVAFSILQLVG